MGYKGRNLVARPPRDIELVLQTGRRSTVGRRASALLSGTTACLGLLLLTTLACGHNIGDSCSSSADCDPTSGTRTCDLSQPGGYCLLEGCDARSCPGDSVCMRVFPGALLTKVCSTAAPCDPDEVCLPYASAAPDGGSVTATISYCARMSLEKRLCLQGCGSSGDCRSGYVCTPAGTNGTIALTLNPAAPTTYCAPP
jgi:hypothetical protein